MNEKGNQYALAALKAKRSALAGEIAELQRTLKQRTWELASLDVSLGLLDPNYDARRVRPKRPQRVKLFDHGELSRLIIDTLRRAEGRPLKTQELVSAALAAHGHGDDARPAVTKRVWGSLSYLESKGSVEKFGSRSGAKWRLAGDQMRLPIKPK